MNQTNHCNICENQKHHIQNGVYCALTDKKSSFQGKCVKIKFGDFLKEKTKKVNLDYELIKKTKQEVYISFIVLLVVSLTLLIGGYTFGKLIYSKGVIATLPIVIMGSGLLTIAKAFGPLNAYNRDIKIAKSNKEKHDSLLDKYGIKYTFDFEVKRFHDIEEITTDLKFPTLKI